MKDLKRYIKEKLFHQQVDEKLIVNKNYKTSYLYKPNTWNELRQIIEERYEKLGPGTKNKPINFNDVDVSGMTTFYDNSSSKGLFDEMKYGYIDISDWNVSNITDMNFMFFYCTDLKSIGDIFDWDVSKVTSMISVFCGCEYLESIDISNWNVSLVENMHSMFEYCKNLKNIGDISDWKVSKVKDIGAMFNTCEKLKSIGDLSNWDVSNIKNMWRAFNKSGITNIPDWYEE